MTFKIELKGVAGTKKEVITPRQYDSLGNTQMAEDVKRQMFINNYEIAEHGLALIDTIVNLDAENSRLRLTIQRLREDNAEHFINKIGNPLAQFGKDYSEEVEPYSKLNDKLTKELLRKDKLIAELTSAKETAVSMLENWQAYSNGLDAGFKKTLEEAKIKHDAKVKALEAKIKQLEDDKKRYHTDTKPWIDKVSRLESRLAGKAQVIEKYNAENEKLKQEIKNLNKGIRRYTRELEEEHSKLGDMINLNLKLSTEKSNIGLKAFEDFVKGLKEGMQ